MVAQRLVLQTAQQRAGVEGAESGGRARTADSAPQRPAKRRSNWLRETSDMRQYGSTCILCEKEGVGSAVRRRLSLWRGRQGL